MAAECKLLLGFALLPAWVERLGGRFCLAPEFFAAHLRGVQNYRRGFWSASTVPELELLPSFFKNSPFYTVEFRRVYKFPGGSKDIYRARHKLTNTPRDVQFTDGLPNG